MPVPYEAALHVTMTGNAMTGMSALTAKGSKANGLKALRGRQKLTRSAEQSSGLPYPAQSSRSRPLLPS